MSQFRRCDSCRTETDIPAMFSAESDDWYYLYQRGRDGLSFCTLKCVTDYFLTKAMIDGIS